MASPPPLPVAPPPPFPSPELDPAFRLFGKVILLPGAPPRPAAARAADSQQDEVKFQSHEDNLSPRGVDELGNLSGSSSGSDEEDAQTPRKEDGKDQSGSVDDPIEEMPETEEGGEGKTEKSAQDKALRKPDKPVPCPRCESLETKFCYYNNYNVNQPRHFCKNCQRYWTAGGTLRNVPVGAGRRKNKHSSSHQRQSVADGVLIRGDDPNGAQPLLSSSFARFPGLNSPFAAPRMIASSSVDPGYSPDSGHQSSSLSSTVTSLTRDMPLCGDFASSWKMFGVGVPEGQQEHGRAPGDAEMMRANAWQQERMNLHMGVMGSAAEISSKHGEAATAKMEETSSCPLVAFSAAEEAPDLCVDGGRSSMMVGTSAVENGVAFPPFFGGPWPVIYGGQALPQIASWPPAAATDGLWQLPPPPLPGPMWNPPSWSFPWSLPWAAAAIAAATATAAPAAPVSSTPALPPVPQAATNPLGKRPRVAALQEGSLLIPKTLRINDPEEAAQSSIWATLGVRNRTGSLSSGGFFNAFQPKAEVFQPKSERKMSEMELLHLRNANPAASARAAAFHECK